MKVRVWIERIWPIVPVSAALLFTTVLLFLFDASPIEAFQAIFL